MSRSLNWTVAKIFMMFLHFACIYMSARLLAWQYSMCCKNEVCEMEIEFDCAYTYGEKHREKLLTIGFVYNCYIFVILLITLRFMSRLCLFSVICVGLLYAQCICIELHMWKLSWSFFLFFFFILHFKHDFVLNAVFFRRTVCTYEMETKCMHKVHVLWQ